MSRRRWRSRAANGSSNSSRRGAASRARPIATRCFSPPERRPGRRPSSAAMPSVSTTWSKATPPSRLPANHRPNSRFCRTLRCGNSCASWKTRPTWRRCIGTSRPGRGVDERRVADAHVAAVGAGQPGDEAERHRLARAGAAEQRRDTLGAGEGDVEGEARHASAQGDVEHQSASRRAIPRCSRSDRITATSEMTIETSVSRSAPASPSGFCTSV